MRIGLKYCGGCNPDYDRVKVVSELRRLLSGRVCFVSLDSSHIEAILVVNGCKHECADVTSYSAQIVYQISKPSDVSKFLEKVKKQ